MSYRRTALKKEPPIVPVDRTSNPTSSTMKSELMQMLKELESKILKEPEKSAKILAEWLSKGKPGQRK